MMSEEIIKDLITLLWSCAVGAGLCVLYEILKSLRISFKLPTVLIIALDILFFGVAAVVTFCLLLVHCRGYVRGFVIFGETVGFTALRILSFGVIHKFFSVIFGIVNRIVSHISTVFHRIFSGLLNKIIKSSVILKKQLRTVIQMMYNHIGEKYKRKRRAQSGKQKNNSNETHSVIPPDTRPKKKRKTRKEKGNARG